MADEEQKDVTPSLPVALLASAALVGSAVWLLWASVNHDPAVDAPLIVVIGLATTFIGGSAMAILAALGREAWLQHVATLILAGFATMGIGLGVFGDERSCSGFTLPFIPVCRIGFGFLGFVFGFLTYARIARAWHLRRRSHY